MSPSESPERETPWGPVWLQPVEKHGSGEMGQKKMGKEWEREAVM